MPLFVARLAKPNNIKRFVIILMVSKRFITSAPNTRKPYKGATSYRPRNSAIRPNPTPVFCSPGSIKDKSCRLPIFIFPTLSIIFSYPFNIFFSICSYIFFVAFFAFINMTIKHFGVTVKVLQKLNGVALKTIFRTNHVELL